jgi:hypothetical protein
MRTWPLADARTDDQTCKPKSTLNFCPIVNFCIDSIATKSAGIQRSLSERFRLLRMKIPRKAMAVRVEKDAE